MVSDQKIETGGNMLGSQHGALLNADPVMLIDGAWRPASDGATIDVTDPATGEVIARCPAATPSDVNVAVEAAHRTLHSAEWRQLGAEGRSTILWRWADLIEANAAELSYLEVRTNGMPGAFADWMINSSVAWLRHFAASALSIHGTNVSDSVSKGGDTYHAFSGKEPVGVCALVIPWNGPTGSFVLKTGPALAAGCTCVIKPAELTPVTAIRLGQLAQEAGLPNGALNIVTGYGTPTGSTLVRHPLVNKVSFTGSTETGRRIGSDAVRDLKRVTLELGGKSPCIVFDDADLETAIPAAAMAIYGNTGQVCFAGSRLFVQRASYDKVLAGIAEFTASLNVGSGLVPQNMIGPLISAKQRDRVLDYIASGLSDGGELVCGGSPLDGNGYFMQPTILANLGSSARAAREEIFGPVLVATPFDEFDEVIGYANDTDYGLGAGIFTRDLSKAHNAARSIRAGNVWVNCYGVLHPSLPFGGFGKSGLGREMGTEGIEAFLETKSTFMKLA